MTSHPNPARAGAGPRTALAAGLSAAALVSACVAGGLPAATSDPAGVGSTAPAVTPATTPAASAEPVSVTSPAPGPTEATGGPGPALAGSPPTAVLEPPVGDGVPGALGGYTWAGAGSDAPWLVPPADHAVRASGPYRVTFDPALVPEAWTARWAPLDGGQAGDPAGFAQGGGLPIAIEGPARPGSWSLQVDARFAGGGRAAWYWRLDAAP